MSKAELLRRNAALLAIDRFEKENDLPNATLVETDDGDRVAFVGTAPDGRQYGCGYLKDTESVG